MGAGEVDFALEKEGKKKPKARERDEEKILHYSGARGIRWGGGPNFGEEGLHR